MHSRLDLELGPSPLFFDKLAAASEVGGRSAKREIATARTGAGRLLSGFSRARGDPERIQACSNRCQFLAGGPSQSVVFALSAEGSHVGMHEYFDRTYQPTQCQCRGIWRSLSPPSLPPRPSEAIVIIGRPTAEPHRRPESESANNNSLKRNCRSAAQPAGAGRAKPRARENP
jgi:hypothetical protein